MLLEKKIVALREELEEREAAMQVDTISFHFSQKVFIGNRLKIVTQNFCSHCTELNKN